MHDFGRSENLELLKYHCLGTPQELRYVEVMLLHFMYETPRFDWYVIQRGSKSKHHKTACLKGIGVHIQIPITTLHPVVTTIGRAYVYPIKKSMNMHFW